MRLPAKVIAAFAGLMIGTFLPDETRAQQTIPRITLSITEQGDVSADIVIGALTPGGAKLDDPGFTVVILPCSLATDARIIAAPDVRVAPVARGQGYALLAVIAPTTSSEIHISISPLTRITETAEGKAKLEFDFAYPFMSQSERRLIGLPRAYAVFDISIVLPRRYDETEVVYRPASLTKTDERTFVLTAASVHQEKISRVWVVFPNPMTRGLDIAKLVFSLVIGAVITVFQAPALRERRLFWAAGMFISSIVVLGVAVYFTHVLAKSLDFLVFASAALPNAVVGLLASIYLVVAKHLQASVTGRITIDGGDAQIADVRIYCVENGASREVGRTGMLKDGVYTFHLWQKPKQRRYQVRATNSNTDDVGTPAHAVARGERFQMPDIHLTYRPVAHGQAAAGV